MKIEEGKRKTSVASKRANLTMQNAMQGSASLAPFISVEVRHGRDIRYSTNTLPQLQFLLLT